jgi:hypothetical protein
MEKCFCVEELMQFAVQINLCSVSVERKMYSINSVCVCVCAHVRAHKICFTSQWHWIVNDGELLSHFQDFVNLYFGCS